jgi:hypothetical protein
LQRFYFDVDNGRGIVRDDEGVETEDCEQAPAEARSVISEMVAELEVATSARLVWVGRRPSAFLALPLRSGPAAFGQTQSFSPFNLIPRADIR